MLGLDVSTVVTESWFSSVYQHRIHLNRVRESVSLMFEQVVRVTVDFVSVCVLKRAKIRKIPREDIFHVLAGDQLRCCTGVTAVVVRLPLITAVGMGRGGREENRSVYCHLPHPDRTCRFTWRADRGDVKHLHTSFRG